MRTTPRSIVAMLVLSGLLAGVVAGAAMASHGSDYWFWQGYLPQGDGTRAVHHAKYCCSNYNRTRVSWQSGSLHDMLFLYIRYSGGWAHDPAYYEYGYDWNSPLWNVTSEFSRGGCQMPGAVNRYTYTNCHVEAYQ